MSVLSFLWSYWTLILPALLAAAAFAYVAFILRNWRAALAAIALAASIIAAGVIYKRGYDARTAEVLAAQRSILQARIKTLEEVSARDAERATADAARIAELQKLVDDTPPNTAPGLPQGAAERIGKIR